MTTKLTITFALTTAALATPAFAEDEKDLPPPDEKIEAVRDDKGAAAVWESEYAKKLVEAVKIDEPLIDEMDPGAYCKDIQAHDEIFMPLREIGLGDHKFKVGLEAGASLTADANELGVIGTFGPGVELLGQVRKPVEVRLSAKTLANNAGNTIDLGLYAFGMEIDSYNIANTPNPIQYLDVWSWTFPNALSGDIGGSIDCSGLPGLDTCTLGWSAATSVVANIGLLWGLRVSTDGVRAGFFATTNAQAGMQLTGFANGTVCDDPQSDWCSFEVSARGVASASLISANAFSLARLEPYNSYWLAAAEYNVHAENILGANVALEFPEPIGDYSIANHTATSFDDAFQYGCTFEKAFK
jgi:hypothetical protein